MRSYVGGCAVEHGQSLVDHRVVDMDSAHGAGTEQRPLMKQEVGTNASV